MARLPFKQGLRTGLGIILAGTLLASTAFAQGPPPFGGPPPGGGPPPISLATLPLSILDTALKLSAAQDAQITQIQQQFRPPPGGPPPPDGSGGPGGPPSDAPANTQIRALLTAEQKQALPALLAKMNALGAAGIPPPVYPKLQLTADQQKQLVALGQTAQQARKQAMADGPPPPGGDPGQDPGQQTREKAMALLTGGQRLIIQQFLASHPPPGPGAGPGDGNGPPPPGQDGPPPSDGSGPPPPDGFGPPPPDGGPPPPGMAGPG